MCAQVKDDLLTLHGLSHGVGIAEFAGIEAHLALHFRVDVAQQARIIARIVVQKAVTFAPAWASCSTRLLPMKPPAR